MYVSGVVPINKKKLFCELEINKIKQRKSFNQPCQITTINLSVAKIKTTMLTQVCGFHMQISSFIVVHFTEEPKKFLPSQLQNVFIFLIQLPFVMKAKWLPPCSFSISFGPLRWNSIINFSIWAGIQIYQTSICSLIYLKYRRFITKSREKCVLLLWPCHFYYKHSAFP